MGMLARIRTIKPEFFKHGDLYDAEQETGLPLRLAFAGLWCLCDREGRFRWKPREMKLDILPYDDVDFSRVLHALATRGFLVQYECDGVMYGWVPSFTQHQSINNKETASVIPPFEPEYQRDDHASATREARDEHAPSMKRREEKRREEKGREDSLSETEEEDDRQPFGLPESAGVQWYEEEGYENRELAEVAIKVAATRIRSKVKPFPYRGFTENDAAKVVKALADCPTGDLLELFWGSWYDYHADRAKPPYKVTGVARALCDWASRKAGVWATHKRLQGYQQERQPEGYSLPKFRPGGSS
jgi:hypothetical protein